MCVIPGRHTMNTVRLEHFKTCVDWLENRNSSLSCLCDRTNQVLFLFTVIQRLPHQAVVRKCISSLLTTPVHRLIPRPSSSCPSRRASHRIATAEVVSLSSLLCTPHLLRHLLLRSLDEPLLEGIACTRCLRARESRRRRSWLSCRRMGAMRRRKRSKSLVFLCDDHWSLGTLSRVADAVRLWLWQGAVDATIVSIH